MNTKFKITIVLAVFSALFGACEKDETQLHATAGTGAQLEASATELVLTKEHADEQAVSFSWQPADFGYQAAITNVLQVGLKGQDFAKVKEVSIPAGTNHIRYTTYDFNAILLGLELPVETVNELDIRVKSSISAQVAPVFSNVLSISATPYAATSYLYVPGAYQNWDPGTAESLISATSNGIYFGIIRFPEANSEFKVTVLRNWDNAYGADKDGNLVLNGGENLKAPRAGNLELTVNTNDHTISFKDNSWGIIGDATPGGWDNDTDMTYDNANAVWKVTIELKAGAYKFRKNHDWGTNIGLNDDGEGLKDNGGDIHLTEAGTYAIVLDTEAIAYTIVKQ